ncbi:hypothetical protein GCM10023169_27370 [Georgenia halophila]|uniref:Uncharacterized protein n=1 Tax=Georgenia halophila TaxID=620889 RepID=A0ABP8LEI3_9MICO
MFERVLVGGLLTLLLSVFGLSSTDANEGADQAGGFSPMCVSCLGEKPD